MRRKYEQLQYAVNRLYESKAGITLYFAGATSQRHLHLFENVIIILLWQGIILASLIMLLSLGHEYIVKTEMTIYSTKVGRRINIAKLISSLLAGVVTYVILTSVTLAVYIYRNPFGATWNSSVSSGFNFIEDGIVGLRPFVTWHSFTVASYLIAYIVVSIGLILCFGLMAYITGLFIRNGYIGFCILVIVNALLFDLPIRIFGFSLPAFIANQLPISLAFRQDLRSLWFTDGAIFTIMPHFETGGTVGSLAILILLSIIAGARFKRRNIL